MLFRMVNKNATERTQQNVSLCTTVFHLWSLGLALCLSFKIHINDLPGIQVNYCNFQAVAVDKQSARHSAWSGVVAWMLNHWSNCWNIQSSLTMLTMLLSVTSEEVHCLKLLISDISLRFSIVFSQLKFFFFFKDSFTKVYFTHSSSLWETMFPFESCHMCFHWCLPSCISPKPRTGTKRQLDALEPSEDIKPELTMKETEEVEVKRAKLPHNESPTKVPLKPDRGNAQLLFKFLNVVKH